MTLYQRFSIFFIGCKILPPGGMASFSYVDIGNLVRETALANVFCLVSRVLSLDFGKIS